MGLGLDLICGWCGSCPTPCGDLLSRNAEALRNLFVSPAVAGHAAGLGLAVLCEVKKQDDRQEKNDQKGCQCCCHQSSSVAAIRGRTPTAGMTMDASARPLRVLAVNLREIAVSWRKAAKQETPTTRKLAEVAMSAFFMFVGWCGVKC